LPIPVEKKEISDIKTVQGDWKMQFLTKCTEALSGENRILIPLTEEIGNKK
jgi:hypothetical protein